MIAFLFGLALLTCLVLSIIGYRNLRSDPLDALSVQDRALIKTEVRKTHTSSGPISRFSRVLGVEIGRVLGPAYRSYLDRKNIEAGVIHANFEQLMTVKCKLLLISLAPAIALAYTTKMPLLAVLLIVLMFFVPDVSLLAHASERQSKIEESLPDFLDILSVTVSAGLSFRGALERVIQRTDGPLAEELQHTLRQMDVGESRSVAFSNLKARTKADSVDSFVTALLQSEELGSPLTQSLEQIAQSMRMETAQKARQRASKASPKISAVVSLVMVPATMVLLGVTMFLASDINLSELLNLN